MMFTRAVCPSFRKTTTLHPQPESRRFDNNDVLGFIFAKYEPDIAQ